MNSLSNNERFYIPNTLDGIDILTENITENALLVDGSNFMMADLDAGGHNIKNVSNATALDEAVNLGQLTTTLGNYVDLTSNQTIVGTKTFSNQVIFNGATKTNLVATDIPNAGNREWLTTGVQTITGVKTFINSSNFNGPTFTRAGTDTNINSTNFNVNATTVTNLNNGANCNNKNLTNVLDPTLAQHASTKNYVDTQATNTNYLLRNGTLAMTGALNMDTTNKIINLQDPTLAQDASTKNYVDTQSTNTNYLLRNGTLAMTGGLDMGTTNKIINLQDPTLAQDASTKNYVDTQSTNTNYVKRAGDTMTGTLLFSGTTQNAFNSSADTGQGKHENYFNGDWYQVCRASTASKGLIMRVSNNVAPTSTHDRLKITGDGTTSLLGPTTYIAGNVGIGTTATAPQTLLDINNSTNPKMFLTRSNITRGFYSVSSTGIDIGADVNTTSLPIRFMPNNAEVLRIQTNGNVGIGTTAPSEKLEVAGTTILNKNTVNSINSTTISTTQTIYLISGGNTIYDFYNITAGIVTFEIPATLLGDTSLINKVIQFNISGTANVRLKAQFFSGVNTNITIDGTTYFYSSSPFYLTKTSSFSLLGSATIGTYTTSTYTSPSTTTEQLIIKSNLGTATNSESMGIKFLGTSTDCGFIEVETIDTTKADSTMSFKNRQSNTIKTPLYLDNNVNVTTVLTLAGGTYNGDPGADFKTNTYIRFAPAGTANDWMYLRQIGGDNAYHLGFDFHDDANDGKVSFRTVESTTNPDNFTTFFTADAIRGFYNPKCIAIRPNNTNDYILDDNRGVTIVYAYGGQNGDVYLPNTRATGMKIEIINQTSQNLNVRSGVPGVLTSLIKNGLSTTTNSSVLNNGWYLVLTWDGSLWVGHRFGGVSAP